MRTATLLLTLAATGACADGGEGPPPSATTAESEPERASGSAADTDPARRGPSWFVDVSETAGLVFRHEAGRTPERHLPETMGAGACLADLDGDGDLEAYLVQGGPFPPGAGTDAPPVNRLFVNDGAGRFRDATGRSGAAADPGYGMGVATGDVDADGDLDLLVTNFGTDRLLANDGTARFADVTARAGVGDERWTGSAAFFDADADGDLDLYVAAYVAIDPDDPPWCGRREPGWRSYCHPDAFDGLPDRFWRNDGTGRFKDATAEAGLATAEGRHGKGLGVLPVDVDADGDLDVYVANDSVENRLWLNRGDGRFEDGTLLSGTGVSGRGLTEAGMGVAAGDVDGDGDAELFVTNFDDESNTLYRNDGGGLFTDVTAAAGLDAPSRLPVGFGTVLADLDDDGDLDAAVVNGHIIDNIHLYHDGKRHAQRALLFANDGTGRFTDASDSAGDLCAEPFVGRGLYSGDVDGDGDLDLLATGCGERARLLENRGGPRGGAGHGALHVGGLPPGTRVVAELADGTRIAREAGPQPSYFGQTAPGVHVGLGDGAVTALQVLRPGREPVRLVLDDAARGAGRLRLVEGPQGPELHPVEAGGTMTPPLRDPGMPDR